MTRHFLVGVDGSKLSKQAFDKALHAAQVENAKLFIVSVINDNNINQGSDEFIATQKFFETQDETIKSRVEYFYNIAKEAGVEAQAIAATGNPKHILGTLLPKKYDIDVIFIGGPEKTMENYFGIGSVASYVIRHSPCDVYVIKD